MKTRSTGPALIGFEERWADYPREDLYSWVRNSQALIQAGHPRATEIWDEFKPNLMNSNPQLTNDDIESVFLYIDEVVNAAPEVTAVGVSTDGAPASNITNYLYWLLFVILLILALILSRIISNLNQITAVGEGKKLRRKSFLETLTSKSVISFAIFALVVLGGYTTVNNAVNLGRQQGYAPEQPIKYSHATHAGLHQIDCQYCHDGARRSKHAVIPPINTCMNCHKAIKVGSQYGTAEITKIFVSSGYDPNGNGKYIEDLENKSAEEIEEIYKSWIGNQYTTEKGISSLDDEGRRFVDKQWDDIVTSLTNGQKLGPGGAVEWTRIHNLPDHVYFNHAQHVTIGKIECQTCHGPVEELEVMQQYAPLSMGWCINCHRKTEVKFDNNEYYKAYTKYHSEMSAGMRDGVTVEDIGGIECQKCHY